MFHGNDVFFVSPSFEVSFLRRRLKPVQLQPPGMGSLEYPSIRHVDWQLQSWDSPTPGAKSRKVILNLFQASAPWFRGC